MKKLLLLLGLFTLFTNYAYAQTPAPGDIIITEFMANPAASPESGGEYIELYNKRSVSFDLEGFVIKDDDSDLHTITGSLVIPAEGFIVLAAVSDPLGNSSNVADYTSLDMTLANSVDEIVLTTSSGTEIARVTYDLSTSNGTSKELDAISNVESDGSVDDSHYSNSVTSISGGIESNGSPGAAGSTDLTETATVRFSSSGSTVDETAGEVSITVILEDPDGNAVDVDVSYNEGGSSTEPSDFTSVSTVTVSFGAGASDGDTQTATFEVHSDSDYEGTEYGFFELSNVSTSGNAVIDGDTTYTLTISDDDTPSVVINEVYGNPDDDADGNGVVSTSADEFVEIYNNEGVNIDIGGWYINDALSTKITFATGTIIKANSAIVVFGDNGSSPVGTFGGSTVLPSSAANLGLNNGAETVTLFDSDDAQIDQVSWSSSPSGESLTRDPDGTGAFGTGHSSASGSTGDISPGTKVDGSWFTNSIVIEGTAGWRLLSIPMSGADVTEISDDTPVQGVSGGTAPDSAANLYTYDEDGSWEVPASTSAAIGGGTGFALYFYNNDDANSLHLPVTLDASGSEPSSDVTVNLSSTDLDGSFYTLVGNPFSYNFDLSAATSNNDGIQANVHFWDNEAGSYEAVDRTTPSIVSAWQGFFVEVTNSGTPSTTITFPESGKTFSAVTDFHVSKTARKRADISFTMASKNSFDKAIRLSFREEASAGMDIYDASKFVPLIEKYATMAFESNDRLKSVESLPYGLKDVTNVQLVPQLVGVEGEFTLTWEGLKSIPADWKLMLNDALTGKSVDMRSVSEYTFRALAPEDAEVNPLTILNGPVATPQKAKDAEEGRFTISIDPSILSSNENDDNPEGFTLSQNYPNPFNPSTNIRYSVAEPGNVNITVYNLMGQKVAELVNETKSAGAYNVTWNASQMASGMYYYRLTSAGQTITRKMTLIK